MPYNVRLIKYPHGAQLRLYSDVVGKNTYKPVDDPLYLERKDLKSLDCYDVKLPSETGRHSSHPVYCSNPFDDSRCKVLSSSDIERSQKVSRNRTIKSVYYYARSNNWDWFVTLTFDPSKVDRYDYDACSSKLHNWLMNCRKTCPNMLYLVVPELHKDGAYHFHGLFANCDSLGFVDSGKRCKKQVIYNIGKYKLGFTTATRVKNVEKVSKYITKYITKDLCSHTFGKKRYWKSRNLAQAEIVDVTISPENKAALIKLIKEYIQYQKTVKFLKEFKLVRRVADGSSQSFFDSQLVAQFMTIDYIELSDGIDLDLAGVTI